jgi:D-alanyl-D-alanine carboxypeptidase (penicillin-binding protein 5/6)
VPAPRVLRVLWCDLPSARSQWGGVKSRGPALLALVALGVLVGVLANALVSSGSKAAPRTSSTAATPQSDIAELASAATATKAPAPAVTYADGAYDRLERAITARSYVVLDADRDRVLLARNDRVRRPIASLTKIMTALLVIEDGNLNRKIKVPKVATQVVPSKEGLRLNHWYPERQLLYSALMVSANDSATALGYAAGDGSLAHFYRRMNEKARELGLTGTTYHSASGLNDRTNLSTALDQALLARVALRDPVFRQIVGTVRKVVEWPPPTYAKEWINHNRMLTTYAGTYGVKTGYTAKAGACLVVAAERGGHHLIGVVLDSRNIWKDMPRLLNAGFAKLGAA